MFSCCFYLILSQVDELQDGRWFVTRILVWMNNEINGICFRRLFVLEVNWHPKMFSMPHCFIFGKCDVVTSGIRPIKSVSWKCRTTSKLRLTRLYYHHVCFRGVTGIQDFNGLYWHSHRRTCRYYKPKLQRRWILIQSLAKMKDISSPMSFCKSTLKIFFHSSVSINEIPNRSHLVILIYMTAKTT